ncbi:MAG: hypothetical protein WC503_05850 [Candidatus Shapirobacteria bacterium]
MKEILNLQIPSLPEATIKTDNLVSSEQSLEIAKLYAEVFRGSPWNEAVKCDTCEQFQGSEIQIESNCDCGGIFKEAYPPLETSDYIQKDSQKPGFRIITAESKGKLIAFSWSYLTTPIELAISKWSTPEFQAIVVDTLKQQGLDANTQFRYLNETGVNSEYRNLGLASRLRTKSTGPEITVARTNSNSPMTVINYTQNFDQIMGPKMFFDRQLRTIFPTGEIANCLDQENPSRVLFIKKI